MKFHEVAATIAMALFSAAANGQNVQSSCEQLRSLHGGASHVVTADFVPEGIFEPPGIGSFHPASLKLPAHCSVRVMTVTSADSQVTSEIWLPIPAAWNGKLLGTGNGGYSSALSYRQMADGLERGFAVAGSDTGHEGDGLAFGTGHSERIRDWAYRSTHVLAEEAKAVIAAFYGKPPVHAYFAGCSTGGQQALSEAQRYPEDFDGIVAGDPGNDRILLNADFMESWLLTHPLHGSPFPASKLGLLAKAVVEACDKQDGLSDGIISDPRKCSFDPVTLACKAKEENSTCLTAAELATVRGLYEGAVRDSQGRPRYPGWPRGSEAGWGLYLVSPAKPVRVEFWSDWVFPGTSFDPRHFDAPTAVARARAELPFVEAVDANLRAFQKAGGKLLLYHGWADPVVPPEDTIAYYEQVASSLGPETGSSVRLFMVPGMGHCGGGPGATAFDALGALDRWVTERAAPDTILAVHDSNGKPQFERPLCPFPKWARWDGKNDPAKANSFRCIEDHPK